MLRPLVTALKSSRSLKTIIATLTMLIPSTLGKRSLSTKSNFKN